MACACQACLTARSDQPQLIDAEQNIVVAGVDDDLSVVRSVEIIAECSTRGYSFSGYQANAPQKPLPGPKVDEELDNLGHSVNQTIVGLQDGARTGGCAMASSRPTRWRRTCRPASIRPSYGSRTSSTRPATASPTGAAFYRCVQGHISTVFADDLAAGYWVIHHNWIVGAQYGVKIEIANHPAGEICVHNNTIEEQGYYGIYAASVDASPTTGAASRFNFSDNEFSNLYTGSTYVGAIYLVERVDGNVWLTDLAVCRNTTRSNSGAGGAHMRISAGQNITISENILEELGPGAPYGIYVHGVVTNASLGSNIQVLDTTFQGTFTAKFILKPGVVT